MFAFDNCVIRWEWDWNRHLSYIIQYVEGADNTSLDANMPINITSLNTHVSVEICFKASRVERVFISRSNI